LEEALTFNDFNFLGIFVCTHSGHFSPQEDVEKVALIPKKI
jgi:hypothetical protein